MSAATPTSGRKRSYQEATGDADQVESSLAARSVSSASQEAMVARQEAHGADLSHRFEGDRSIDQHHLLEMAQQDQEEVAAEISLAAQAMQQQMEENAALEAQVEQYAAQLLEEAALAEDMMLDDT